MATNVAKSYLDLAKAVISDQIKAKEHDPIEDAIFGLMSCTYVYSYSSLVAFCSAQLYLLWREPESQLRSKYTQCANFEQLMAGPLKEIKSAIKEIVAVKKIRPVHEAEPKLWQNLNEFIKNYRDFFLHPNPELFEEMVGESGNAQWRLASDTAAGLMAYIYQSCTGKVPNWVHSSGLSSNGFIVNYI